MIDFSFLEVEFFLIYVFLRHLAFLVDFLSKKMKRSYHTRLLLDALRVYDVAEGLVLLSRSPPLTIAPVKKLIKPVSPAVVDSDCKVPQHSDVTAGVDFVLDVDGLMTRFPMLQRGGCRLVYRRRRIRRSGQVSTVDDGSGAD
ncbi:hypothetical protein Hanom_Chr08g00696801 [Helianthus anomalus]